MAAQDEALRALTAEVRALSRSIRNIETDIESIKIQIDASSDVLVGEVKKYNELARDLKAIALSAQRYLRNIV